VDRKVELDLSSLTPQLGRDTVAYMAEKLGGKSPGILSLVYAPSYHQKFGAEKIVLIGDAAHATVPFAGQGMNVAFEDAALISDLVNNSNRDLAEFSALRVDEMTAMHRLGMLAYANLCHPIPKWRMQMSSVPTLYSLINYENALSYQQTLQVVEDQNKWYKIGRIV
jgi:kynurenine 3-monooxygenase